MTVADLLPPPPEQLRVKLLFPIPFMVTVSLPEVLLVPDQFPEAEQEVALDDDHVNVELVPKRTEVGFAEKLIVGAGVVGVGGSLPPPPPPPPQATKKIERQIDK